MKQNKANQIEIIDAHHHFWALNSDRYALFHEPLKARRFGDYRAIMRDYLPADYRRDTSGIDVAATIHVEAGFTGPPHEETGWLARLHDEYGLPTAALIHLKLAETDVAEQIKTHRKVSGNVQIVGVRQHAHWSPSDRYTGIDCEYLLQDKKWRDGIKTAVDEGLVIELPIFFNQADDLLNLMEAIPDGNFVLGHAALPVHFDRPPIPFDRPEDGWREAIEKLAQAPNLSIKLSGFWMCGRALSHHELKSLIVSAIAAFGPDRCIFGSNFPVDKLHVTFGDLVNDFVNCVAEFDSALVQRVMFDNAARLFKIRLDSSHPKPSYRLAG